MATQLDLQEQEQLDALKAFWNKQGNLITWTLVAVLGGFAAWNGWQYWQREQSQKAATLYEELDRAALANDAEKSGRVFGDLKERYARTAFAGQAGLVNARVQVSKGQLDAAKASLAWVAENGSEEEIKAIARLRLAGVHADAKQYDEALKVLDAVKTAGFEALVADRRGDVLAAQGKAAEALSAYQSAWTQMNEKTDYRRLVEAKLTAMGAAPAASSATPAAPAASGAAK
jgi:predicted negative regulator of RcsB-dependent stress response